jgi:hypothetical protein
MESKTESKPLDVLIGRVLTCEDGEKRVCISIAPALGDYRYVYINDSDLHAGHQVHILKAQKEIAHEPPPTREELEEFDKIAASFSIEWKRQETPSKRKGPKWAKPQTNWKQKMKLVPRDPKGS